MNLHVSSNFEFQKVLYFKIDAQIALANAMYFDNVES